MNFLLSILFSVLSVIAIPLHADEKLGVVLMHGKWGTSNSGSPIGELASYLKSEGVLVTAPDMPWSRNRELDKSYEDSMTEIDNIVKELRDKGATKIVVGGHSMGANAAIGYGARREGLAGVLAIAPGHVPELSGFQAKMDNDWKRAKEMVDSGEGDKTANFKDVNQRRTSEKSIKASVYLSWYDPDGPAVMPTNVKNLKPGTPILWIIGEKDRMYDRGKEYAFSSAPPHDRSAYVIVKGGHKVTPKKGKTEILDWLKSL